MNEAIALLLYYGSALVPIGYLIATVFRGRRRRAFLITLGLHLLASLCVVAFTCWCRSAGYREWYWAVAYNIPMNGLFALAYVVILFRSPPAPAPEQQQSTSRP